MLQPVLMINGFIVLVLGFIMLIPAFINKYYTGDIDYIFIHSSIATIFIGGSIFLANLGKIKSISILQGYLITIVCWFSIPLFCAIPFYNNGDIITIIDAIFESTSGLTTTGATILTDIEAQPKSILLWRSILHGLGGIGIVIFAVALLPFLGIGGMNIFSKESSDTEDKFLPKLHYIAKDIIIVYISLNILCALALKYCGMDWFDAINHALATISTGGFSTKNTSILYFDNVWIEAVMSTFMLLGAMPQTYFVLIAQNKKLSSIVSNSQVNTFIKLSFIYILLVTCFYAYKADINILSSLRVISFNLISAMSTTGFASTDFLAWGSWVVALLITLQMHGGCTGSSAGSIKIFRWQVIAAFFKKNFTKSLSPNQVCIMKVGNKIVDDDVVSSVFAMAMSFLIAVLLFTLIISLSGFDFVTSIGAVMGTITSFGPGLTDATGPVGNYAIFTPFVKCILSLIMILGRLEVITVVVLLSKIKLNKN